MRRAQKMNHFNTKISIGFAGDNSSCRIDLVIIDKRRFECNHCMK